MSKPPPFLVIAHRGASGTRPENTLAAFARAMELGAPMVELDVQLTGDGEVVVLHDWTLDRTTDGTGPVGGWSLADLRRLDAGRWFDAGFAGERVPTLAEVLDLVPARVNVELKAVGDDGLERRTLAVVERAGALGRVVFSSFLPESLVRLRALSSGADVAVLSDDEPVEALVRKAERVGARALHVRNATVTAHEVAVAHRAGLAVRVWTVNEQDEFVRIRNTGADGIFTDFPERFLHNAPSSDAGPGAALPTDLD